jgi:glycosyltransferase involved in cell wall biosynthesis
MSKTLKIAVDVRDLRMARTGTRTYLEELCKEFKKLESPELKFYFFDTTIPVYSGPNKLLKIVEHVRYQLWKQLVLPVKALFKNCDIVFCTDNFVPLIHLGFKTIPVFHDAFFLETPQNYSSLWLWLYNKTAIPAARRSPYVITPSNWAKKQINHYTGISNDKLIVIHEGPKTLPGNAEVNNADELLRSLNITPKSYLFHVGSMFKRKNIPALIQAFAKLKAQAYPELKLVLAGETPPNKFTDAKLITDAIAAARLQSQVILTGYLSDEDLGKLYTNALLYVFPSINEGFGIPILEAFSNKLPVLVANNTCLPEIGGNAVLQFDPFDIDDISSKIKIVLDDKSLQADMIVEGSNRLKLFSWHNAALQLVEVFKKAV